MLLHHAVVRFISPHEDTSATLAALRTEAEVDVVAVERLSIHDVRSMIERAYQRPFDKPVKVCVVQSTAIAHEAQQALLKILEEPPATTQFLFLLPAQIELLPTIYSRVVIEGGEEGGVLISSEFASFLQSSVTDRLTVIAQVTKDKDGSRLKALLDGLTQWLSSRSLPENAAAIVQLHAFLYRPGASKKMLWESLAFLLPVESIQVK